MQRIRPDRPSLGRPVDAARRGTRREGTAMTPARSLTASVVALGFASTLTAPLPAIAAPAPCERAENYAAQSGAELLRINRLERHSITGERPVSRSGADKPDGRSGDGPQGRPGADA